MQPKIRIVRDTLTPQLQAAARRLSGGGRREVLRAMGEALVGWTKDAFKRPARRPEEWPPLKGRLRRDGTRGSARDGTPLLKSRMLMTNIHVARLSGSEVTVAPAQDYGVHHQFGAPQANIPARPFFPFDSSGRMMPEAQRHIRSAAAAKIRTLLPN